MELGMLYDSCTDTPIKGETLWSRKELNKNRHSCSDPYTNLTFIKEDESFSSQRAKHFQVDASLQASVLSGLFTLGGSAKYLNDNTQTSKMHRRVTTLHYEITTKQETLSITDMTPPKVCSQKATHFVTSVTYGAHAFLVFYNDSAITKDSHKTDLSLSAKLKTAMTKQLESKVELSLESSCDTGSESAEELVSCTLYGDFISKQNPTNYKQALKFCRDLPTLCETNVVSVRVTLTPLSLLQSGNSIFKEVDYNLLSTVVDSMHSLELMRVRCHALTQRTACAHFPSYRHVVQTYFQLICSYTDKFRHKISQLLPDIRRGVVNVSKLQEAIAQSKKSPFISEQFMGWIESREKELRDLEGLLENLPGIQVIETPEEFYYAVNDPTKDNVVCFALPPILLKAVQFLKVLELYMTDPCSQISPQNEFDCFALGYNRNAFGFYKENMNNDKTTFVATSFSHNEAEIQETGSILLFTRGRFNKGQFEPPGEPEILKHKTRRKSSTFTLSWEPSNSLECVKEFRVAYRQISFSKGENEEGKYKEVFTKKTRRTFTGLSKNTTYEFQVFAVYSAWTSMGSEKVSYSKVKRKYVPKER